MTTLEIILIVELYLSKISRIANTSSFLLTKDAAMKSASFSTAV